MLRLSQQKCKQNLRECPCAARYEHMQGTRSSCPATEPQQKLSNMARAYLHADTSMQSIQKIILGRVPTTPAQPQRRFMQAQAPRQAAMVPALEIQPSQPHPPSTRSKLQVLGAKQTWAPACWPRPCRRPAQARGRSARGRRKLPQTCGPGHHLSEPHSPAPVRPLSGPGRLAPAPPRIIWLQGSGWAWPACQGVLQACRDVLRARLEA